MSASWSETHPDDIVIESRTASVLVAAIILFVAWAIGVALAGEPGLPLEQTPPPTVYAPAEGTP